jgi:hypothetical protein
MLDTCSEQRFSVHVMFPEGIDRLMERLKNYS